MCAGIPKESQRKPHAFFILAWKRLSEAQSAGDMPSNVYTHDFTGKGLETQYKHGTACAEILHDMAPEAELHLMKIGDEIDLYWVMDYCREKKIDIISVSVGTFGSGPGNGTGPIHDKCDEARANGILVVAAAGNNANFTQDGIPLGTHWKGTFTDYSNDSLHEFSPGIQGSVLVASPYYDDDGNPEHDEVTIVMRWNDWPYANTDYDLYLYHYDYDTGTLGALVESSTAVQNGSQPPVEDIIVDLPDTTGYQFYQLRIAKKANEPAGKEIELFLGGTSFFVGSTPYAAPFATSSGSIWDPSDAASVLAVGAINYSLWAYGPLEDFSSRGPTNAWAGSGARIKPDICGPDGVSTHAYGASSFLGTSAATPHVAAAAALILSKHPNMLPGEVQSYLESWAEPIGATGKDNLYGSGKLRVQVTNYPPVFNPIEEKAVDEGQWLSFVISASDPERDNLTFSVGSIPSNATFNPNTRLLSWRPTYHQQGIYGIRFEVSDGTASDSQTVVIRVSDMPPKGDIDDSGVVDLVDAITSMRVSVGLDISEALRSDYAASGADVDGDDTVGTEELVYILQVLSDLR